MRNNTRELADRYVPSAGEPLLPVEGMYLIDATARAIAKVVLAPGFKTPTGMTINYRYETGSDGMLVGVQEIKGKYFTSLVFNRNQGIISGTNTKDLSGISEVCASTGNRLRISQDNNFIEYVKLIRPTNDQRERLSGIASMSGGIPVTYACTALPKDGHLDGLVTRLPLARQSEQYREALGLGRFINMKEIMEDTDRVMKELLQNIKRSQEAQTSEVAKQAYT